MQRRAVLLREPREPPLRPPPPAGRARSRRGRRGAADGRAWARRATPRHSPASPSASRATPRTSEAAASGGVGVARAASKALRRLVPSPWPRRTRLGRGGACRRRPSPREQRPEARLGVRRRSAASAPRIRRTSTGGVGAGPSSAAPGVLGAALVEQQVGERQAPPLVRGVELDRAPERRLGLARAGGAAQRVAEIAVGGRLAWVHVAVGPRVCEIARRAPVFLEAPLEQAVPGPAVERVVLDDRSHHSARLRDATQRRLDQAARARSADGASVSAPVLRHAARASAWRWSCVSSRAAGRVPRRGSESWRRISS